MYIKRSWRSRIVFPLSTKKIKMEGILEFESKFEKVSHLEYRHVRKSNLLSKSEEITTCYVSTFQTILSVYVFRGLSKCSMPDVSGPLHDLYTYGKELMEILDSV